MKNFCKILITLVILCVAHEAYAYRWLSPYAYCAGNPVNFVDPDGRVIMIRDSNGNLIPYRESSDDAFVNKVTGMLNDMKSKGGGDIVNTLHKSDNVYVYTNEAAKDGGEFLIAGFTPTEDGGNIKLGDEFMVNDTPAAQDYIFGHETFHGYQHQSGQNALTISSEIGAIVFGVRYSQINSNPEQSIGFYPATVHGSSDYQIAIITLIDGPFDSNTFSKAVNLFKSANGANIYKKFPIGNIGSSGSLLQKSFIYKR